MQFNQWLDTLIEEKQIDTETVIEVEGDWGTNFMPLEIVVDAIKSAPANEKAAIKDTLVKIDFVNGDIIHFFTHLAQAIAI